MKYQVTQLSIPGARAENEDRASVAERPNAVLLVVADGLGGHSGGELAAQTVVETVTRLFQRVNEARLSDPFAFLALTLLKAHEAIRARARAHVPPLEARTTCVLCLIQEGYACWAHVGDSRLYHFRHGRLLRRTEDHTAIEELRRDGVITEEEMATHPRKSYLLSALGGAREPRITLSEEVALQAEDTLLLCTDGLWEALAAEEIGRFIAVPRLDDGIEELVYAAERRGGETCDNVTVACLRWEERAAPRPRLRAPIAPVVDADLLRREAATRVAARRATTASEPRPTDRPADRRGIESRIQELEEYLNEIETRDKEQDTR